MCESLPSTESVPRGSKWYNVKQVLLRIAMQADNDMQACDQSFELPYPAYSRIITD